MKNHPEGLILIQEVFEQAVCENPPRGHAGLSVGATSAHFLGDLGPLPLVSFSQVVVILHDSPRPAII